MIKFLYLILILFSFNLAHSLNITVPEDFKEMLRGRTTTNRQSFSTTVTRPFIKEQAKDTSFFSEPRKSYQEWKQKKNNVNAFTIFETMGESWQGLVGSYDSKYQNITDAQREGMLRIVRGELGFQNRSCAAEEEAILAYELLSLGNSLSLEELKEKLSELESGYNAITNVAQRQHMQLSALFLLSGNKAAKAGEKEWFLENLNQENVLKKIQYYKELFLKGNSDFTDSEKYKDLIKKANAKEWVLVQEIYGSLSQEQPHSIPSSVMRAISRLSDYYRLPETERTTSTNYLFDQDSNNLKRTLLFSNRPASPSPEIRLESYLDNSRILTLYSGPEKDRMRDELRKATQEYSREHGNEWPREHLALAEQFFWNLRTYMKGEELIKVLFKSKIAGNWKDFKNFFDEYTSGFDDSAKMQLISRLLNIYLAFPTTDLRKPLIDFCRPYFDGDDFRKISAMNLLLPIYQVLFVKNEMDAFNTFCQPYFAQIKQQPGCRQGRIDESIVNCIFSIYQTFPNPVERQEFESSYIFGVGDYLINVLINNLSNKFFLYKTFSKNPHEKTLFAEFCRGLKNTEMNKESFSIYQSLSTPSRRQEFIDLCKPYWGKMDSLDARRYAEKLLPVYLGFSNPEDRKEFITFCETHFEKDRNDRRNIIGIMEVFLPIYQSFSQKEQLEDFLKFHKDYLQKMEPDKYVSEFDLMKVLLELYQSLPEETQREDFFSFSHNSLKGYPNGPSYAKDLFDIYQAFPIASERADFLAFCSLYLNGTDHVNTQVGRMSKLFSIYQSGQREDFDNFMKAHL